MLKTSLLSMIVGAASFLFSACVFQPQPAQPEVSPKAVEESPGDNVDVTYEFMATQSGTLAIELLQSRVSLKTKANGYQNHFVTSINGLAADDAHQWKVYLNGYETWRSVNTIVLQEGDTLRVSYQPLTTSQLTKRP